MQPRSFVSSLNYFSLHRQFIHVYRRALPKGQENLAELRHRADRQLLRAGELFRGGSAADWRFWREKTTGIAVMPATLLAGEELRVYISNFWD